MSDAVESPTYYILARLVGQGKRKKVEWYKPLRSEVPLVAIEAHVARFSRMCTKLRLYKLSGSLQTARLVPPEQGTLEYPNTFKLTKAKIRLVRRALRCKVSHWLKPPPKGLEASGGPHKLPGDEH